jgi:hypothetical protein
LKGELIMKVPQNSNGLTFMDFIGGLIILIIAIIMACIGSRLTM